MQPLNSRAFREMILRKYKDKKIPVMGDFEITGRCNFNCKMCYVHTKPNAEFAKTERSGDWWIALMEECCKQGMMFALLTGGECLLHPDFRRIYKFLRSKGVYTSINTNGYLLTQDMVDFLKEDPPFELQITLYGADDEGYYQVTGNRAFNRVRDSLLRAKEANFNLRVAITPNSHAIGETERIVKYLKSLQVNYVVNQALHTGYDDDGAQKLAADELGIEEKIRYFAVMKDTEIRTIPEGELPVIGSGKTDPIKGLKCSAGAVSFHITHDGYMIPCPTGHSFREQISQPDDFLPALMSIRKQVSEYLIPVECEGCAYRKACLPCAMLRGGKVGNGHCDPVVCEETRRLVAAGVKEL